MHSSDIRRFPKGVQKKYVEKNTQDGQKTLEFKAKEEEEKEPLGENREGGV